MDVLCPRDVCIYQDHSYCTILHYLEELNCWLKWSYKDKRSPVTKDSCSDGSTMSWWTGIHGTNHLLQLAINSACHWSTPTHLKHLYQRVRTLEFGPLHKHLVFYWQRTTMTIHDNPWQPMQLHLHGWALKLHAGAILAYAVHSARNNSSNVKRDVKESCHLSCSCIL